MCTDLQTPDLGELLGEAVCHTSELGPDPALLSRSRSELLPLCLLLTKQGKDTVQPALL